MELKKQDETIVRLQKVLDHLNTHAKALADGDGDIRMLATAVAYWEYWTWDLGRDISLVTDAFDHGEKADAWMWKVRNAHLQTVEESVRLIAREAERENIDTTALWRGWGCLRKLFGDSRVELRLLCRDENWPNLLGPSHIYVLDANAVIERLETKVDLRGPGAAAASQTKSSGSRDGSDAGNTVSLDKTEAAVLLQLAGFYPRQVGEQDFDDISRRTAKKWLKALQAKGLADSMQERSGWVITAAGQSYATMIEGDERFDAH